MQVTDRKIATDDNSKLIYFVEADDGSGVALKGDRGPSGVRGLKGDSGDQGRCFHESFQLTAKHIAY